MNKEETQHYRKLLEEQLASLEKSTSTHQENLDDTRESGDFVGGERAAELENLEVDASVAESEFQLARKIRHALERIEDGSYGLCESCGQSIPAARLEAKPSVSLCLSCQEKHEAGA